MKVLKFGGSSVANTENIKQVLSIVAKTSKDSKVAVIVSAFGKTTNNLIAGANEALEDITAAKEILDTIKELHFKVIDDLVVKNKKKFNKKLLLYLKDYSLFMKVFFYCKNYLTKH